LARVRVASAGSLECGVAVSNGGVFVFVRWQVVGMWNGLLLLLLLMSSRRESRSRGGGREEKREKGDYLGPLMVVTSL